MYIPETPEIQTRHDHVLGDAASVAAATIVGAAVGTWLDNNTRFGHWINHSPVADAIVALLKITGIIVGTGLGLLYLYFFISA